MLVAIGSPLVGIPILLLAVAGLWLMRPGRTRYRIRAPRRPARISRPRTASISGYQAMTPGQFEHALADLCRRDGCTQVRVVGGAGDLAADVLATTPDGRKLLIQAKRFGPNTTVGSGDVQKVNGTYRDIHHAQLAAIVTTNRFTKDAEALARRVGIRAYDQHRLASWASRTGPAPWQ
ncbi:restriction endonuclease [Kitasatospora kifunensis]|uniref:Restriction system protein n=1 Tax=Kitasatospora kifunensis TaxID=58351 RepID=A0A7W7QYM9_KITKI|nr:restriction endonuclease [Kitasatospora kifunensis]MBB4922251.1 restriction system protein [Kitasatospora kifunensis]